MTQSDERTILERIHANELSWVFYAPLLFTAFYFVPFFVDKHTVLQYITMTVTYGVFIVLYSMCRIRPERALYYLVLIGVLVISISVYNPSSYTLIWYATYVAAYVFPLRKSILIFAGVLACLYISGELSYIPTFYFLVYGTIPSIALYAFGSLDYKVKKEETEKREKNKQIERLAIIAERERLSRDMHDVLGHNLTALSLKAQLAAKLGRSGDIDAALKEIDAIADLASSALSDVRDAISQYKSKSFQEHLDKLVGQMEAAGFKVTLNIASLKIDAKRESGLILILTEAVTNILRHSRGKNVRITFLSDNNQLKFSVEDDGKVANFREGNGLSGIQSRVDELSGKLDIRTDNGFALYMSF